MVRVRECVAGVLLAAGLFGCQARQMVDHYASFDAVVTELYDKHVLYNLARRDAGRTMVQMEYTGVQRQPEYQHEHERQGAVLHESAGHGLRRRREHFPERLPAGVRAERFQQHCQGAGDQQCPGGGAGCDPALYEEQVNRPEQERIFQRTSSPTGGDAVVLLGADGAAGTVLRAGGQAAGVQRLRASGVVLQAGSPSADCRAGRDTGSGRRRHQGSRLAQRCGPATAEDRTPRRWGPPLGTPAALAGRLPAAPA